MCRHLHELDVEVLDAAQATQLGILEVVQRELKTANPHLHHPRITVINPTDHGERRQVGARAAHASKGHQQEA